ncbi:unnamed protein product [Prorocentrum cordatum]|uniref:Uncharacterized protein n=1 Tax=Prorocentrum cordatum TaxID=2364126 RepID=A0ABN9YB75_9DINO|nr:unnamed protein product [Polarella glacialis]
MKVAYSIVNLYADGADWTDFHRDNYRPEGNRMKAQGGEANAHNATIGASFGAQRELRFRHLETGLEFAFPQGRCRLAMSESRLADPALRRSPMDNCTNFTSCLFVESCRLKNLNHWPS